MSDEIPSTIVSQLCFVGREGGLVKTLSGFQKGRHTLPTAVNDTTLAFLAKLCAADLAEHAEARFQQIRAGLGYKRRELTLSVQSPAALLTAAGFSFEMAYGLEEADPSRYTVTHTLRGLRDPALARHPAFDATFAGTFSEISFGLRCGTRVEAVIDAIEGLDREDGLTVDYPSDCHECTVSVPGVEARVRCTGETLDLVFTRAGSPAELIDGFAAVRLAFSLDPELAGLIG
jgi:hypothetical protein